MVILSHAEYMFGKTHSSCVLSTHCHSQEGCNVNVMIVQAVETGEVDNGLGTSFVQFIVIFILCCV